MSNQDGDNPVALISVRFGTELAAGLRERGEIGAPLFRRELARYYTILEQELKAVSLSEGEALLIVDALNGHCAEPIEISARLLWAVVEEALPDGLAEKWDVDGPGLVRTLKGLTFGQAVAIIDAVERVWRCHHDYADMREVVRVVGLVR